MVDRSSQFEARESVIFIPGLYPNLPLVGDRIKDRSYGQMFQALQSSVGGIATVDMFDPQYHAGQPAEEIEGDLEDHLWKTAERLQKPVGIVGASLGGNLAFGAALRAPDLVARAVAVSSPLKAEKSPPPFLRIKGGLDMEIVDRTKKRLVDTAARQDLLSNLVTIYGENDFAVKPDLSQWDGIQSHTVSGAIHPRIITKVLAGQELMVDALELRRLDS